MYKIYLIRGREMKKIKITQHEFIKLCNEKTYPEVAKILNISESLVYKKANELGVRKKAGRPKGTGIKFEDEL